MIMNMNNKASQFFTTSLSFVSPPINQQNKKSIK